MLERASHNSPTLIEESSDQLFKQRLIYSCVDIVRRYSEEDRVHLGAASKRGSRDVHYWPNPQITLRGNGQSSILGSSRLTYKPFSELFLKHQRRKLELSLC